jgi:hypothetical protein
MTERAENWIDFSNPTKHVDTKEANLRVQETGAAESKSSIFHQIHQA